MKTSSIWDWFVALFDLLTGTEPYTHGQPCRQCNARAEFVRVLWKEPLGYGEVTYVLYSCPHGHEFEQKWKAQVVGDP
jgi:hypothetical protein